MKILFLTRRFYPDIGGVEKHVFEISKRLVGQGHFVTVISEGINRVQIKYFEKSTRIKLYKINAGKNEKNKKFIIWQWLLQNKKIIEEADVVHCHDVFFWFLPFRFLYPSKPVFTTFHGYENYPIKKTAIFVRKISEKLSWGNICIGNFMKKWYGTKPTFVSYGAVDVSKFSSKDWRVKNSELKKESALFFGRLDEQTGILTYMKAFEILKKIYPKFELLVIGDGKYKSKVSKNAKTLNFQKELEKYFKKYHFSFVSRYLSILEAFAAKRLVFAVYDNPVKEDYLRMTPFSKFIIIEKDYLHLAKKVQSILEHPELENKMIENAYEWVKKQSWEEMVKLYLSLWKRKK